MRNWNPTASVFVMQLSVSSAFSPSPFLRHSPAYGGWNIGFRGFRIKYNNEHYCTSRWIRRTRIALQYIWKYRPIPIGIEYCTFVKKSVRIFCSRHVCVPGTNVTLRISKMMPVARGVSAAGWADFDFVENSKESSIVEKGSCIVECYVSIYSSRINRSISTYLRQITYVRKSGERCGRAEKSIKLRRSKVEWIRNIERRKKKEKKDTCEK